MSDDSDLVATMKSRTIICAGHVWTRTAGNWTGHKMDTGKQKTAIQIAQDKNERTEFKKTLPCWAVSINNSKEVGIAKDKVRWIGVHVVAKDLDCLYSAKKEKKPMLKTQVQFDLMKSTI